MRLVEHDQISGAYLVVPQHPRFIQKRYMYGVMAFRTDGTLEGYYCDECKATAYKRARNGLRADHRRQY